MERSRGRDIWFMPGFASVPDWSGEPSEPPWRPPDAGAVAEP
jgi:hypothetical protein